LSTKFDQTFTTDGLWDMDKRNKFWGQKSKVKITVGLNMTQRALFGLISTAFWAFVDGI